MEFNATFLATIATFIVFVILMNKVLYEPILSIIEKRKSVIDENYKNAQKNNTKSLELTSEKEAKLAEAKEEAKEKYNEIVNDFKNKRTEVVENAQYSAKEELERSNIELGQLSDDVKNGLKGSMVDLANDIVEKVIGYRSEVQGFDEYVVNKVLWEK